MSQINRRGTNLQVGLLAGLGALLLQTSPALAVGPVTFMIADGGEYRGNNEPGENTDNEGAGTEQLAFTTAIREGRTYVLAVYMNSNVDQEDAPNQCKCTSVMIDPIAGPQVMADQVYLTDNQNTDQPCNHPQVLADDENILFAYGYAPNNNNTQTYVRGINHLCESVTETKRVSNNNNNNQGAPDVIKSGVAGRYQVGYYDNNDARTYVRDITVTNGVIENVALNVVVTPSNIGRPSMASDGMYTLVCAAKGDQRPPEDGVACAYLDNTTGEALWTNEIVAESQPGQEIYMNSPSVALLSPGRFAVQVVESTGAGKNTGTKGGSKLHIYMTEPNNVGPNVRAHATNFGVHAVHGAIVTGKYSQSGEPHIGLFEAPVTGSGLPVLSFFNYDVTGQQFGDIDTINNQWVAGATNADSGYLNNIYGNNPGTQGREFLRAIGDVANPGALVDGGWMNEVETFFVVGYGGMSLPTDTKNHGYLTFIPGKTKVPVVPESPTSLDPADVGGGATPPPPPAVDPEIPSATPPPAATPPVAGPGQIVAPAATGACSASTEGTSRGNMAGLVALGLALVGLSRRRRAN